jgi:hypothetical protein
MLQQKTLEFQLAQLRHEISTENRNYAEAIMTGKEFKVAKQIVQKIGLLQKQAENISGHLATSAGYLV